MSWGGWGWLLLVVVMFIIGNGAVCFVLIRIPPRYFCDPPARDASHDHRHVMLRWAILIGKNLAGVVLAASGLLLSLPGVPGPGLLLILLGVMLLNFPGKRRLERKLVGIPGVLRTINRLRERFGHPPLVLACKPPRDEDPEAPGER